MLTALVEPLPLPPLNQISLPRRRSSAQHCEDYLAVKMVANPSCSIKRGNAEGQNSSRHTGILKKLRSTYNIFTCHYQHV